ncbi:RagB/SusD family nutrient uptake outer membrane protein [Mucilaginibacter limnophilus]|uniref:RagB/SusD family nutrient uptake outer membrane protein n=1 Tax=Mucilaginibacter limnophilus TaxID=1932778 RepID=A0A437MYU3_9SPHI|nr:RagB/SusD family nutrient uptake outer membrane protein [Mucilaginibacter limnophilus]RVU02789.1 RagB/SusD family nutrient uptake outer membrane protein [Mucilaginibacter limnophilus]
MKKYIAIIICAVLSGLTSCKKFLEENPRSDISPGVFYKTESQAKAAVTGCYKGLESQFLSVFFGLSISDWISVETLPGFATRTLVNNAEDIQFTDLTKIEATNSYVAGQWKDNYLPINNCNSVIQNLTSSGVLDEATKSKMLGEVYFLRAYYYFQLVRLFGDVPLRTVPATTLEESSAPRNKQETIYNQIVSDLKQAEGAGLPTLPQDNSGRVTVTAVKSLLAKVYLTMAGAPLNKGTEYYQLAYDKAKEVITSNDAGLIPNLSDILTPAYENKVENIFMVQRQMPNAPSMMHYSMLPIPTPQVPLGAYNDRSGAMQIKQEFYNSYRPNDIRNDQHYLYDYVYPENGNHYIMVYKYWDGTAINTGDSGANIPLIRYADVLLIAAEARAMIDGGSTSDATAIQAYNAVHTRAVPGDNKATITFDDVFRERFWEFCFENQTWFDMKRTLKTMDVPSGNIVNMIGYKAPAHGRPFEETDLYLPIPQVEIDANPRILEPAQ